MTKWYLQNSSSIIGNFVTRRNDFQGLPLTIMTEAQSPFTAFDSAFMQNAKFHVQNETYEIRNYASGLFFELFKVLEKELNFTGHVLKRKDSGWGGPSSNWPNGMSITKEFQFSVHTGAEYFHVLLFRYLDLEYLLKLASSASPLFILGMGYFGG